MEANPSIVTHGSPQIELKEQGKGWRLAFRDASVHLIQIDFRLSLLLLDPPNEATVIIETPCRLKTRDTSVVLRAREPSTLAPILRFFNTSVTGLSIRRMGALRMEFRVDPHSKSIPIQGMRRELASSTMGFLLICAPGGAAALFKDPARGSH
jgi:hypothetical protein